MLLDNFFRVFFSIITIPGAFRVNHHGRSEFATVKTAGAIDTDIVNPELLAAVFHIITKLTRAFTCAAAFGIARITAVFAAENMGLEIEGGGFGHGIIFYRLIESL